jgi:hypothetical protein
MTSYPRSSETHHNSSLTAKKGRIGDNCRKPSALEVCAPSKSASAFFRRLEEKGKLVKLASDTSELNLATGMMSPDEWIHRGLEFAWKAWECRSEDRGGGGSHDMTDELRWLDLATDCFGKAGSSGQSPLCQLLILF